MIVVCIDNNFLYNYTVGKRYLARESSLDRFYYIMNDLGYHTHCIKKKFKPLAELRKNKLKKI